ncbi:putative lipoyltransferase 2, mitochondrial [Haliotis rufescens]|uniref:putative lipoyltransferase 2, mitochondrial n=1 Tax=Haliotis rufescens TaxID=6454 RepID=UPI001EB055B1|nr:putative lipoyltransferase 2, mitochondrial [Haliotis rufescens]
MSIAKRVVQVINLGRMGFMAASDVQQRYARQHFDELAGKSVGSDTILLVEHNPVYTTGIRTSGYDADDEKKLKTLGAEFFRTNRGGLITFHGPGQLVAYPILNLKHFEPSMKWYIASLEKTMIGMCKHFGVSAKTTQDTGVWVNDRKIGAIGVHGSRYVTTHGISVNCDTDLDWYKHIVPCGIEGKEVTSLSTELRKTIKISDAIYPFLKSFEHTFDCQIEYSLLEASDLHGMYTQSVQPAQQVQAVRQMSTLVPRAKSNPMW